MVTTSDRLLDVHTLVADTDIGEVTFAGTDVTPVTQTLAVLYYALANGAYLAAS